MVTLLHRGNGIVENPRVRIRIYQDVKQGTLTANIDSKGALVGFTGIFQRLQ